MHPHFEKCGCADTPTSSPPPSACLLFLLLFPLPLLAHPIPTLPVAAHFSTAESTLTVEVLVDPRSFAEDPEEVPYLEKQVLDQQTPAQQEQLRAQAQQLTADSFQILLPPGKPILPPFDFSFEKLEGKPTTVAEEPMNLRGRWTSPLHASWTGFQVLAQLDAPFEIIVSCHIDGTPQAEVTALFPGEESFLYGLERLQTPSENNASGLWTTFQSFLRQGYVHVLPLGLDHILFILGLFLLSRKWRPLLLQVTTFTLAHTLTLGLATFGLVNAPSQPVEVIIAASISIVALQNIFRPRYTHNRLWAIFVLGLIHGLGFAGALSDLGLNPASAAAGLAGFNIGVELGQIAVLLMAWVLTLPFTDEQDYRRTIVVPTSICIALIGLWWVVDRL